MKKLFTIVLMAMMMVTMCFTTAFAADTETVKTIQITTEQANWLNEHIEDIKNSEVIGTESWIKNFLTTDVNKAAKYESKYVNAGAPIQLGPYTWDNKSGILYLKKGKTLEGLSQKINQSMNNSKTVDRVNEITDGLNIIADTGGAAAMLQGFTPIISLIVGVMVTLITIGMTLFSASDIAFIALPVYRNMCEDAKIEGKGPHVKHKSNGETKLRFVTDDAQYAVSQATIESGVSPWGIYFKRRIMSYVMLAIILFILLTGNISLITNIALKVVSGIMNILGGLA